MSIDQPNSQEASIDISQKFDTEDNNGNPEGITRSINSIREKEAIDEMYDEIMEASKLPQVNEYINNMFNQLQGPSRKDTILALHAELRNQFPIIMQNIINFEDISFEQEDTEVKPEKPQRKIIQLEYRDVSPEEKQELVKQYNESDGGVQEIQLNGVTFLVSSIGISKVGLSFTKNNVSASLRRGKPEPGFTVQKINGGKIGYTTANNKLYAFLPKIIK